MQSLAIQLLLLGREGIKTEMRWRVTIQNKREN